jgi:hypothetical protein
VLCRPYSAGIVHSVSDQMQNLPNYFTTPNKMTSENDIKGLVSLKFLRPWCRCSPHCQIYWKLVIRPPLSYDLTAKTLAKISLNCPIKQVKMSRAGDFRQADQQLLNLPGTLSLCCTVLLSTEKRELKSLF